MDIPSSTLPSARPVNTRYQSVQGVTSSIKRPMRISGDCAKNSFPSSQPRIGVKTKLMAAAVSVKRRFAKDVLIFFRSTDRKRIYNSSIRKTSIRPERMLPGGAHVPSSRPSSAAARMITGWSFPRRFISASQKKQFLNTMSRNYFTETRREIQ